MLGYLAMSLALAVGAAPGSSAQGPRGLDDCTSVETAIEPEERQTSQRPGSSTGIYVDVPIGRVCLSPESVSGEPAYVRRTTVGGRMTIVEISTTPFGPGLPGESLISRPEAQPASW